jgi:hypothetical protein
MYNMPGLKTNLWGPPTWVLFHSIAFSLKEGKIEEDKKTELRKFYSSLAVLLPCSFCRVTYNELCDIYKVQLNTRKDLILWTYHIHNMVNTKLKKPLFSFESYLQKYKEMFASNTNICE